MNTIENDAYGVVCNYGTGGSFYKWCSKISGLGSFIDSETRAFF